MTAGKTILFGKEVRACRTLVDERTARVDRRCAGHRRIAIGMPSANPYLSSIRMELQTGEEKTGRSCSSVRAPPSLRNAVRTDGKVTLIQVRAKMMCRCASCRRFDTPLHGI